MCPNALSSETRIDIETCPRNILVVVPARDEEALLPACLDGLEAAIERLSVERPETRVTCVVVLDRCTDSSADIVASRHWAHALVSAFGQVGAARRAGVEHAAALAGVQDARAAWVANTDADSVVPDHWLTRQLELACGGADLVLGTVVPDTLGVDPRVIEAWHARHVLAEDHPYVHGANLGVRLSTYRRAGEFPELPVHEDVRLVDAIRRDGAAVVATATAPVVTSGRFVARTPEGFAGYLRGLAEPPDKIVSA